MSKPYFIGANIAARLQNVVDGRGSEQLAQVLKFDATPEGESFWYVQAGRKASGLPFTSTALTYLARYIEEAKKSTNPINKTNIGKAARFLTGTEPTPILSTIFAFGDTPQGYDYWFAQRNAKSGKDLSVASRIVLETWVLEAAADLLK